MSRLLIALFIVVIYYAQTTKSPTNPATTIRVSFRNFKIPHLFLY